MEQSLRRAVVSPHWGRRGPVLGGPTGGGASRATVTAIAGTGTAGVQVVSPRGLSRPGRVPTCPECRAHPNLKSRPETVVTPEGSHGDRVYHRFTCSRQGRASRSATAASGNRRASRR